MSSHHSYRSVALYTLGALVGRSEAFLRTIGSPHDSKFIGASEACGGNDQANFKVRNCARLMACVLESLDAATQAGMQSGGNIASLTPTVLALLGASPLELVLLALQSPHRALATCLFSIGLPTGLFRQLESTMQPYLSDKIAEDPQQRRWQRAAPIPSSSWVYIAMRIFCDMIMLALAGIMLWRNWYVGSMTMITWRCEYSWLLLCWPIACACWLIIAMATLVLFAKSIEISYSEDDPDTKRRFWHLMLLAYNPLTPIRSRTIRQGQVDEYQLIATENQTSNELARHRKHRPLSSIPLQPQMVHHDSASGIPGYSRPTVTVTITMHSNNGLRSWRCYEAMIETLAVGIYLYATLVLTSTVFLNGQEGIIYICVMVLGLAVVRVLGVLF